MILLFCSPNYGEGPLLHALLSNRGLGMCSKGLYDHDGGAAAERIIGHPRTVVGRRMIVEAGDGGAQTGAIY